MGIVSEVDIGLHKLDIGLMLRQAILIGRMLYSAEAWSGITDKELARMEVVDSSLTGGHVKCGTKFLHLEIRTWKLRHHLTYLRPDLLNVSNITNSVSVKFSGLV